MAFEINVQARMEVCLLHSAGMETDTYQEKSWEVVVEKRKPPFEVKLPYFLADKPADVSVTLLEHGPIVRIRIDASDRSIERAIQKHMQRYSAENDGDGLANREHDEAWQAIGETLKPYGLSYNAIRYEKKLLTREAIEDLIKLAKGMALDRVNNVYSLFSNGPVARADKEFAVRWLMKELPRHRNPSTRGDLSLRIWENTVPAVGEELVKLIAVEKPMYDGVSGGLLMALAKTKHPRAAEVIAGELDNVPWVALQALAQLKATQYAPKMRKYLRDSDSDIRRQAKKALTKLGAMLKEPPPPKHVVKGKPKVPKILEEWSSNLDMDEVEPTLKKLAKHIDAGFGKEEIAEVLGVLESLPAEKTKAFRFPVTVGKKSEELWIAIFMDDVDSPDVTIHAPPDVIDRAFGRR